MKRKHLYLLFIVILLMISQVVMAMGAPTFGGPTVGTVGSDIWESQPDFEPKDVRTYEVIGDWTGDIYLRIQTCDSWNHLQGYGGSHIILDSLSTRTGTTRTYWKTVADEIKIECTLHAEHERDPDEYRYKITITNPKFEDGYMFLLRKASNDNSIWGDVLDENHEPHYISDRGDHENIVWCFGGGIGAPQCFHNNKYVVTSSASCESGGEVTYHCNDCGNEWLESVGSLGHDEGSWSTEGTATCTGTATKVRRCNRCSAELERQTVSALGHNWQDKWYPQDGVSNAYKQSTCTRCGATTGSKTYRTFTVTYITRLKDSGGELTRDTQTKTFNDTARGSEMGTGDNIRIGPTYYMYVDDTKVDNVRSDCTVYRNVRNKSYTITYVTRDMDNNNAQLATTTKSKEYGSTARGNELGTGEVTYNGIKYTYDSDTSVTVNNTATVYRNMKRKRYTVTYVTRDADNNNVQLASTTKTKKHGDMARGNELGTSETRYNDIPYTYVSDTSTTVSGNTTVYRNYQQKRYTITYITQDTDNNNAQLASTTKTKKHGDTARGNELGTGETKYNNIPYTYVNDTSTTVSGNVTVYRRMQRKRFTITYVTRDVDSGNAKLAETTKTKKYGDNARGNELGTAEVRYSNIPFTYVNDTSVTVTQATTVYRNLQRKRLTVKFIPNTGTGSMGNQTVLAGMNTKLNANAFSKVGYSYLGWATSASGNVAHANQATINIVENLNLYAKWKPNEYKISFDARYTDNPTTIIVTFDSPYGKLPNPTVRGRAFTTWSFLDGKQINSTTIVKTPSNHTLVARWDEKSRYLKFISPKRTETVAILEGNKVTPPFIPEDEGMVFKWWSTTPNGPAFDFNNPINDDTNFYAVFEGVKVVITAGPHTIERRYPEPIGDLPEPEPKSGYEPDGWAYTEDGTPKVKPTDGVPYYPITVYPVYHPKHYEITLPDGTKIEVIFGEPIPELPNDSKRGHTFTGWTYNGEPVKGGDIYKWVANITLVPEFKPNIRSIVLPDGTGRKVLEGDPIGDIPIPTPPYGKEFDHFEDQDGNPVTPETIVDKDLIIKVIYQDKTVTLELHDDDWSDEIEVPAGKPIDNLPDREKPGYDFKGWSKSGGGTPTTGPFTEDTPVYAVYTPEKQEIRIPEIDTILERYTGEDIGSLPKPPAKPGKEFDHWEYNGEEVKSDTKTPIGGMTLTPVWRDADDGSGDGLGDGTGGNGDDGSGNGGNGSGNGDDSGRGDTTDTIVIRYWSDEIRINTVDLVRGDILYDPGAPAINYVESRHFKCWLDKDGNVYEFGHRVTEDLDLYASWAE